MSLVRSSCLLALTMMVLALQVNSLDEVEDEVDSEDARVNKRQVRRISVGTKVTNSVTRETTLTINGMNTIVVNDPNLMMMSIDNETTVRFIQSSVLVMDSTTRVNLPGFPISPITSFTFVRLDLEVITQGEDILTGPGVLYWHPNIALFVQSENVNIFIENHIRNAPTLLVPPDPVEVLITLRVSPIDRLVLNIDATSDPSDGVPDLRDDILQLTDSTLFMISGSQTLLYFAGDTLLVLTRSVINERVENIAKFFSLTTITRGGFVGLSFIQVNNSQPISGPGQLRIGMEGGQRVAFFSNNDRENNKINSGLVSMQLNFQATNVTAEIVANFPPALRNRKLITLNGAQAFNFPTATRVEKAGSVISVFSDSRLLQQFITESAATFNSFVGHQVQSQSGDVTLNLEDGGATLWFNFGDNEAFLYPSRNQVINGGINQAIQTANIVPPVMFAIYSLSSDVFGVGLLSAKVGDAEALVEVVNVAPARVIDVTSDESVQYTGGMLRILSNGNKVGEIPISTFTVNAAGREYLSSEDDFAVTFGGPGRLYVDTRNRAFFTRNTNIQAFINSFVNSIPQPRIDVIRDPNEGLVYFQSGGQNLLTLNGAGVSMTGLNTASIYFDNQINFVNRFDVPENARVTYNMVRDTVRVEDTNGRLLFEVPAGTLSMYDDRPTRPDRETNVMPRVRQVMKDSNRFFFQNGNIYYGEQGVLVSSSDVVNNGINLVLLNLRSGESIPGITNLTSADGSSIITYSGSAPVVLPNGGSFYFIGGEAMYIADRAFNLRIPGIYSQLNPSRTLYNRTTGEIILTTSGGDFISSLRPGVTRVTNLRRSFSFRYGNGMIIFTPEITEQIEMIDQLIVWDGLVIRTYTAADGNLTFSGPGSFWVIDGTAFFTSDDITINRLTQRINNVISTFRRPIISMQQRTFTTKFSRFNVGGFPQTINLYEGADIDLQCTVLATNPPATITFSQDFLNASGMIEKMIILDMMDNYAIIESENTSRLIINSITINMNTINNTGTGVFTCRAENIVGSSSVSTTINVRPARPPAIVTGFIPPLDTIRNSSERLIAITSGDNLMFTPRTVLVEGSTAAIEVVDDGTVIVRTLHIGCKGEGLPKSDITWYQVTTRSTIMSDTSLTSNRVQLQNGSRADTTSDLVKITVPRGGRSVLTIELNPEESVCRRYICEATTEFATPSTALGGVDICPEFYSCEAGDIGEGPCSGTCGLGIARRRYQSCTITGLNSGSILYEEIPSGLFPLRPPVVLCGTSRTPCPIITYQFVIVSVMGCSVTCGVGSIMRTIGCQQTTVIGNDMTTMMVNDSFCAGQRRPAMVVTCRDNPPCPFWSVGEYGVCSSTCRGGMSTRDVNCIQPEFNVTTFEVILNADNTTSTMIVDDDLCANGSISRPFDTIACNENILCPFRWSAGPWGQCSAQYANCQVRTIFCERYDPRDFFWPGTTISDSFCESQALIRPHFLRSCGGGVCGPGRWQTQTTQACSVTCGVGRLTRRVYCVHPDTGRETIDGFCNPFERPAEVVTCKRNCPGVCVTEPDFCSIIKALGCRSQSLARQCCMSCPKQAII